MPRPPASPEYRERERQKLRRAAAEIHAEAGLEALTVRRITERAGVSPAALYNFFPNLRELVRSLWLQPITRAGEQINEIAARHDDPVERIRAILDAYVAFATAQPEIHRGVLLYVRPAGHAAPEQQRRAELPLWVQLHAAIEAGQESGTIREGDPDQLAQLLWAGVHGALALPINVEGFDIASGNELSSAMIDLLVRSIRS